MERNINEVHAYIRVSTETQVEKGYGLDTQELTVRKFANDNNLKIVGFYIDKGKSGAKFDIDADELDDALIHREQLLSLLENIKEGQGLLVVNTSRLWRSDGPRFYITRQLMRIKADIISVEQPNYSLYDDSPLNKFVNTIMDAVDVLDRDQIAVKLAKGRTTKAKKGTKPAGVLPLGYKYSYDKKSVEIDDMEAIVVKKIFSLAQVGKSTQKIADTLNSEDILTRRKKKWTKASIHKILTNDFYLGVLTHKGEKSKGNHKSLISKVQFGKVASALKKKRK